MQCVLVFTLILPYSKWLSAAKCFKMCPLCKQHTTIFAQKLFLCDKIHRLNTKSFRYFLSIWMAVKHYQYTSTCYLLAFCMKN